MSAPSLEGEIVRLIETDGPMPLDRYMAICLGHPDLGYYTTRDPLGKAGDFTTAPEISQTFGEMIGVWCAQVWTAMGSPARLLLVELGPGRGTLMADLERASHALAPFAAAIEVHLVETSPVLKARQAATLAHLDGLVAWHERVEQVPSGCTVFIANEFFDALPVRQFEQRLGAWHERVVGLDGNGAPVLGLAPDPVPGMAAPEGAQDGSILEVSPARAAVARHLGARCADNPGAGLVVDYGHVRTGFGDTVQAVKSHEHVPVMQEPGACDLTAHVDFEALRAALGEGGARVFEPMQQGAFLRAMGIEMRLQTLLAAVGPSQAHEIEDTVDRLIHVDRMGAMFKVCAFASPGLADLYPFQPISP
jgi:SAM-dependent MidA family methyltransferase